MPYSPTGTPLTDGFPTYVSFSAATGAGFWEKTITPPGLAAGGPNDTTTMRTTRWRTRQPKKLVTADNMTGDAAYDPAVYNDLIAMIGVVQVVTVWFPDGSTVDFHAWLDEFKPNANKEGEQPTAAFTIIPSNQTATGLEVAPAYTAPTP